MKESSRHGTAHLAETRTRIAHELHEGEKVERAITILRPASELFAYWRNFHHLPNFMKHLESIRATSSTSAHWIWRTLGNVKLEWDTEIIAETQDRMISWQTSPDASVLQAGSVWFKPAPQDGATEVQVQLMYRTLGGKVVRKVAELFGEEPSQALHEDLRRLKWLMEAGEIPTTSGQPHGAEGFLH